MVKKILLLVLTFLVLGFSYVNADLNPTIHSTSNGGNWNDINTWQEGRIPTITDVVEINGVVDFEQNIEVNGLKITEGGIFERQKHIFDGNWGTNDYNFNVIVNGDIENNGNIVGFENQQMMSMYGYSIHVKGNVVNNKYIGLATFYLYGDFINTQNSTLGLNLADYSTFFIEGTGGKRNIVLSNNSYANINLGTDIEIPGNFYLKGYLVLNNHTLKLDGTKNIYSEYVNGPGKILSSNGNGDGENMTIGTLYGQTMMPPMMDPITWLPIGGGVTLIHAETNIENLYITHQASGVKARKVRINGSIEGTYDVEKIIVEQSIMVFGDTTINGDLEMGPNGKIINSLGYTFLVNGNTINSNNDGIISYQNPQANNSNTFVVSNIPSQQYIILSSVQETVPESNTVSNEDTEGDPVTLSKGEFTYDNTLMQYASKGFPFEFNIRYKNQAYYNGIIGNNFDFNYNQFLVNGSSGTIYYHNGNLQAFEFKKTADGYEYNKAIKGELTETGGIFTLELNNTKTLTFNSDKRLTSISDNYGNTQNFAYTGSGQLIKITDTNSREYNLSYYEHTRLKDITDFAGNKVEFIYFGSGETDGSEYDMKTIKMTNGSETREISFTYTIADTFENSHNILKLIDSENNTYVENAYDTNDRVTSQMYGSGTIFYTYVLSEDGKKILENHVVDREENQTTYKYDTNGNTIEKLVGTKVYKYEYNDNNYLSKEINPLGNGYTYLYDTNNNLTEKRFKTDVNAENSEADLVTSFTYDQATNKPLTITMPNGLKTVLIYDTNGNLTNKKTYDNENILLTEESYEYNTAGELVKKIDPKLNETSFEYTNGNLTKIIKGTGTYAITTQYNYDTKGNITSITDGEGNETQMTYDDFNLLNKITTPESIVSEYSYNNLNKKTNEKIILSDTESVDTAYTYDILDNPTLITTDLSNTKTKTVVTAYDKNSNITETKVGNLATNKFEYDAEGNITKKTTISATLGSIVTTYEYDENNRLIKVIAPNNTEIVYSYNQHDQITKITDSNGTYSKLEYNKAGNITKREVFNSTDTLLQRETYSYDSLGREIETKAYDIQNNKEIITSKEYDKNNNITKTRDAKQNETSYSYDQFDRLTEVTDFLGNKVQNSYNKNNKVVETKVIGVNGKTITTNYEYDSDNRLTKKTDTNGFFETYTYNKLNQIIEKKDKKQVSTYYTYDYVGNVLTETTGTKIIHYEYNDNAKLTRVTDANNNITNYDYDDLGNLTKITYPDQNHMTYEYDKLGNLTSKTDPNGTIVTNTYDSQNRLTHRSIQTGTDVLGVTSENYTYDALGRLLTATDNEGNDLNFAYNSLSRLTSETNGGKTVNYTYDDNGNNTSIGDVNYTYDTLNRLESVKKGTESIANYNYDSLNLLSQTLGNGVQTNYTYDTLNRLKTLGTYTYDYDSNSNITTNGTDSYSYDNLNQLTAINYDKLYDTGYKGDKINKINYDSMGNRTTLENYRLKEKQTQVCTDETVIEEFVNANGKTKTRERKVRNCTPEVTVVEKQLNTLDFTTNELNQYTLLENKNKNGELKKEFRYKYDLNGNLQEDDINRYSYDYKNRLVKVVKKEIIETTETGAIISIKPEKEIVRYSYDTLGRRTKKIKPSLTTTYYYANNNAILEETRTNNNTLKETRENIFSNKTDDILVTYITNHTTNTTTKYYYEKDHLGSIIKITNQNGTLVEEYQYDAFGIAFVNKTTITGTGDLETTLSLTEIDGSETDTTGYQEEMTMNGITYKRYNGKGLINNTRLYTGREYEKELKLYYNRARYYNPQLGRFISRDPIDISDDVNLYTYVGNNPVMYVDVMGLEKTLIIGFTGYPGPSAEFDNNESGIYQLLQKFNNNSNVITSFIRSDLNGDDMEEAQDIINKTNYTNLIIIGHSVGADTAVELSTSLKDQGEKVDLLVTQDICGGYGCLFSDREISSNVIKTVNYYQTNDFVNEDLPLYVNPFTRETLVENHIEKRVYGEDLNNQDVTNTLMKDSYHTTIDIDTVDQVYKLINTTLGIN